MAIISKSSLLACLITLVLFISAIQAHEALSMNQVINVDGTTHESSLLGTTNIDCGKECSRRCQLASRQKICKRACGTCCARCHCVPPGTSGHKDVCPCYAALTTHGGRKKCP
ncbi:snakin-2-like [Sesamum indicum]|uniref:Snakin-2-like n=1 Tax=Sesamum indicum TaxID=4182 RepID=A0A6I9SVQ4_SESIN|nr:snakin-2-like [Sesamum indicum]